LIAEYHGVIANSAKLAENPPPGDSGGIREQVPEKYAARYQHWKQEFSCDRNWPAAMGVLSNNPNFTLTVVITRDNPEGGNTGNYEWNDDGKLVAATITLGCRLDEGVRIRFIFP